MDVLCLTESDVERLLTMEMALEAVEQAFRAQAARQVTNQPRRRLRASGALLHYMAAADESLGYFGMKLYTSSRSGVRFLVLLYRSDTGELLALLEADTLGCLRTGAATGVATNYMARADARRAAILGCGHQAPTQLQAIARVRPLERVRVYSRTAASREAFAEKMSAALGLPVEATTSAEQSVRDADIIATITSTKEPVLRGEWLAPGAHVNAAGVNSARRRELDEGCLRRASRIVVDSLEQARTEAGDLIQAFEKTPERWQQVCELSEVVAGKAAGREGNDDITVFKSSGVALEDVATAARVYERALKEGVGQRIPMWEK